MALENCDAFQEGMRADCEQKAEETFDVAIDAAEAARDRAVAAIDDRMSREDDDS